MAKKVDTQTFKGAICPSCGRHDAIITRSNKGLSTGYRTTFSHPYCGYEKEIYSHVKDILHFHGLSADLLGADSSFLSVTIMTQDPDSSQLTSAISEIQKLPCYKAVNVHLASVTKDICPVCQSRIFVGSGENLRCINGHITISAADYLSIVLKENFIVTYEHVFEDDVYTIYCVQVSKILSPFVGIAKALAGSGIADVTYRYNSSAAIRTIIIKRNPNAKEDDFCLVKNLFNKYLGTNFKIIVAETN
jgi:hypothetical protein